MPNTRQQHLSVQTPLRTMPTHSGLSFFSAIISNKNAQMLCVDFIYLFYYYLYFFF